jgi:phage terminase small subunit
MIKTDAIIDLADHGLTWKQETFAHAYLAIGNATEAYRRSYDCQRMSPKSIATEALRLLKHPGITRAIKHYRRDKVIETMLTLEQHMAELRQLRETAKAIGNISAAIRAEELRGKLCGFYVESAERRS